MADQVTLVIIKPDALRRGLAGHILSRLEQLGLEMVGAKVLSVSRALAEEHYRHLRDKPFFEELLQHVQGKLHGVGYVLAFVLSGPEAIRRVREVTGATHPEQADPLSLRGSVGRMTTQGWMENLLHASENEAEARREIALWFRPDELRRPVVPRRSPARR